MSGQDRTAASPWPAGGGGGPYCVKHNIYYTGQADCPACVRDRAATTLPPLVVCPNCHGRPLPGPLCAVCEGFGKTTPERAETVRANARSSRV